MDTPRRYGKPYVWVTWITSLLSGEKQCVWAAWFRAHYRYQKRVRPTFDLAAWSTDHAALVQARALELQRDGWHVRVENQNSLKLEGKTAILAGKPDIIAVRGDEVLIVDAKTGQQRASDLWQILIYMVLLARTRPAWKLMRIRGEISYPSTEVPVPADALSKEREAQIFEIMSVIGDADTEPARVPSGFECAFCDVAECPDRITEDDASAGTTNEF